MRADLKMKVIGVLLLSVALLVSAEPCTPETCGDGPVWASFDSEDCTGTPVFTALTLRNEECTDSRRMLVLEDRVTNIWYDSSKCDENESFWAETSVFGVCSRQTRYSKRDEVMTVAQRRQAASKRATGGRNTKMVLAHVNATYSAPQNAFQFDPSIVSAGTGWDDCYSKDNCTLTDGSSARYYENYYGWVNCTEFRYSEMMTNMQPGLCYNYFNLSYTKGSCTSDESYQFGYYSTPDCSGTPHAYDQALVTCGPNAHYQGYCIGDVQPSLGEPTANSPPPSGTASSSLYTSAITIFIAIVAAFSF